MTLHEKETLDDEIIRYVKNYQEEVKENKKSRFYNTILEIPGGTYNTLDCGCG